MVAAVALADPAQRAGVVVAALLAAAVVLAPVPRGRAGAMAGLLLLTPVLLLAEIWSTPQLDVVRERPLVAAAGAVAALALVAALAALLSRRPAAMAVLAVLALPFRVPIEAGGSTSNLLVPLYGVIAAGALAWLVPRLRAGAAAQEQAPGGWLERLLLGGVVLYALQAAYSGDFEEAQKQLVFFYLPFALLFALLRELRWTPRLAGACLGVLVALAAVFVGIGFWEYSARELLLNPKVISSNEFESYFRVNSLFFDPNIYGRFLALVILALTGVLLWRTRAREVLGAAAAVALLWGGLVLTFSQSSFAALLVGLAVLGALRWRPRPAVVLAAAAVAAACLAVVAFPSAVRVDLASTDSLNAASSGRADLLAGGVELWSARPLLGWGSGSFSREYRRQGKGSRERAVSASHTIPVTIAAEQGVLGLAVYLALVAAALVRLLGRGARASLRRAVVAAAFCALVVHTLTYAAFLEDPVSWALLGVGTALARRP